MTYDDLKSTSICQFKSSFPVIDPREVHVVMWRSRPLRVDTCSRAVPEAVSVPATAVVSTPVTATITTSALPNPATISSAASSHLLSKASEKSEQHLEPNVIFYMQPPVIAGAVRHRVFPPFIVNSFY